MQKGIGVDIIEIERIRSAIKQNKDKFLQKIFTKKEISYCKKRKAWRFPELAARFAAKEAYSKAIGTGIRGIKWREIEVINNSQGKPNIFIKNKPLKNAMLSISHSENYAVAIVMIL